MQPEDWMADGLTRFYTVSIFRDTGPEAVRKQDGEILSNSLSTIIRHGQVMIGQLSPRTNGMH